MNVPVVFALGTANRHPTGTGGSSFHGSFFIVVQNLNYAKEVSIWADMGGWKDIKASYVATLPGGLELWKAPVLYYTPSVKFVAKYIVNGSTYWDNNGNLDYLFPMPIDADYAILGLTCKVVLGQAHLSAGALNVEAWVQDLAFAKVVAVVLTTDNWATMEVAYATYGRSMMIGGPEVWEVTAPVGAATDVKFAIFYRVLGTEFWDNNFWRNYHVAPGKTINWADAP